MIGVDAGLNGIPAVDQYLLDLGLEQPDYLFAIGRWAGFFMALSALFCRWCS
ncbi:MAG: hypothetical protein ACFB14_05035 [Leptolyngbyaceae cyanobacterium]